MNRLLMSAAAAALLAFAAEAQARDQIRVVGSSTVFPFSTAVAEQFGQQVRPEDARGREHRHRRRHQAVLRRRRRGTCRTSPTPRGGMKKSELDACAAAGVTEITEIPIGFDGIVRGQQQGRPGSRTSSEQQLWLALAKEVPVDGKLAANPYKNWSEIDPALPDEKIEVLGPAADLRHARQPSSSWRMDRRLRRGPRGQGPRG